MEAATTRYVSITTIATFFSSVTATTLQISITQSHSAFGGVVNLFWFLSLIFSVSSGVSSLLGLTWRKSSMCVIIVTYVLLSSICHLSRYGSPVPPPKFIIMWLDSAPMIFLVIAAAAFIIGLNLLAYLTLQVCYQIYSVADSFRLIIGNQPHYVSLATNIFTGLHGTCILAVTAWFIYRLKYKTFWAEWIRKNTKRIRIVIKWVSKIILSKTIQWIRVKIDRILAILDNIRRSYMSWVSRPLQSQSYLHLKRNLYWYLFTLQTSNVKLMLLIRALGNDRGVAFINLNMNWDMDHPDPSPLSKLIRNTGDTTRRYWYISKATGSAFIHSTIRRLSWFAHTRGGPIQNDLESRRALPEEETETANVIIAPRENANQSKVLYREFLWNYFGRRNIVIVRGVMTTIDAWESGE